MTARRAAKDWHREDIKAALRKQGHTTVSISVAHGYHPSAVRGALQKPWPAVERIIAQYLGLPPHQIWPSRYNPDGRPLHERRGWKDNPHHGRRHDQKRRAA